MPIGGSDGRCYEEPAHRLSRTQTFPGKWDRTRTTPPKTRQGGTVTSGPVLLSPEGVGVIPQDSDPVPSCLFLKDGDHAMSFPARFVPLFI